jgi:NAD(P)-dependent dehydrogenase (short-subunit alcohol dehydrogenase family)
MTGTAAAATAWTEADIPDCGGRTFLVTGANTGIGLHTARALAQHGGTVLLAVRDQAAGQAAAERIRATGAPGAVTVLHLDLADLASVAQAAEEVGAAHDRLDGLINNAGVMVPPYTQTADGFELQFGVNHLGHFALTGRLLPLLLATTGSRVVTVSSSGHRGGEIRFDDLNATTGYDPGAAYGQSKLANLLFAFELQRRLAAAGADVASLAAHPGGSATNLYRQRPGGVGSMMMAIGEPLLPFLMQSAAMGALPSLRAATDPEAVGGQYYGPDRIFETRGHPVVVTAADTAYDKQVAAELWSVSEGLTGVAYPLPTPHQ